MVYAVDFGKIFDKNSQSKVPTRQTRFFDQISAKTTARTPFWTPPQGQNDPFWATEGLLGQKNPKIPQKWPFLGYFGVRGVIFDDFGVKKGIFGGF